MSSLIFYALTGSKGLVLVPSMSFFSLEELKSSGVIKLLKHFGSEEWRGSGIGVIVLELSVPAKAKVEVTEF